MEHLVPQIKAHFDKSPYRESCGVIVVDNTKLKWIPCENVAVKDNDFVINARDYASILLRYRVYAIVHNHINYPPIPSTNDITYCNELAVPFIIFNSATMEKHVLYPNQMNLIGRPYIFGIYDCLSVAMDWYAVNRKITFNRGEYEDTWWKKGKDYLTASELKKWGFKRILEPFEGDIVLFRMGALVPNHIGVLLKDDTFLHHAENRLSTIESLYPLWGPHIVAYYTYDK